MDIVKSVVNCGDCSSVLVKPVTLPCGYSVCYKHLDKLQNGTFFCKLCEQDHKIEGNYMNVNKTLEILIQANLDKFKFGPVYNDAFNVCNDFEQIINEMKTITYDPNYFIHHTIDKFKNSVEIMREEYKLQIDEEANEIIQNLDKYANECKINLDSGDFKQKLQNMRETLNQMKQNLTDWKKTLNDFSSDEHQWKIIKQKSNESKTKLKKDSLNFKKQLLLDQFKDYFSSVDEFPSFDYSSSGMDEYLKKFNADLSILDTSKELIIDEAKKQELCKLCNFKPDQKWKLIYKASEHGYSATDFHLCCDDVAKTLTVIKSTNKKIFGGYTSVAFDQSNTYKNDPNAFLFSLVNVDKKPVKLNINDLSKAIYCGKDHGPTFGSGPDLSIEYNSKEYNYYTGRDYPVKYSKIYENLFGSLYSNLDVLDIEIYQIS